MTLAAEIFVLWLLTAGAGFILAGLHGFKTAPKPRRFHTDLPGLTMFASGALMVGFTVWAIVTH